MRTLRILLCVLTVVVGSTAEGASLRWQFKEGDVQKYRMTQSAHLELHVAGNNKVVSEIKRTFELQRTVQSVDPQGVATIVIDVTGVELHVSGPGGQEADYDSKSSEEPHGFTATLVPLFQTLIKSDLVAKMNSRGELLELQVPEDLKSVLRTKPAGKAVGQLGSAVDLESFARLSLPPLPEKADFAQSGQWEDERTVEIAALGPLVAKSNYRWESTADENGQQIARILPVTIFRFPEPKEGQPTIGSGEHLSSGQILFNVTAGRLESASYTDGMDLSTQVGNESTAGILQHSLKIERIENDE